MARSPFRILKLLAWIAVILVCANVLHQQARTGGFDLPISNDRQPAVKGQKRDWLLTVAPASDAHRSSILHRAAVDRASPVGMLSVQAAAKKPMAYTSTADDRMPAAAVAVSRQSGTASTRSTTGGEAYAENAHSACWPQIATRGSSTGDRNATCRTASKRVRIPKLLAGVIESSGRRAATSLADVDIERSLVFVTGASANHFVESLSLIQNLQLHHPGRKILYWDLGLTEEQAINASALCGVTYRKFDFSGLPSHVRSLVTYAFKPLCILRSLDEHSAIWWVDSSVRFRCGDNVGLAAAMARDRRGLLMFLGTGHYVFEATHRQMFDYLATDQERLMSTRCAMGGSFVVVNTRDLFERVLRWYYWCALDERCIAPVPRPTGCQFSANHRSYANCHRFDQCALNILSANMWQFDGGKMSTRELNFTVKRGTSDAASLPQYCEPSE